MLLTIQQITDYLAATVVVDAVDHQKMATDITWDSREVTPDCVYVALPGQRVDGHDFAGDALRAGAVVIIGSHELSMQDTLLAREMGAAVLLVDDCAQAITDLAASWRNHLTGHVIVLTGSSGKTTTKNLVRDVLSSCFSVVATEGNQNNELGVPKTLLRANPSTRYVVVEMGMRGLGQLSSLCEFVKPDMALITNVGESHIELLGSRENIARAKAEVLCALPDDGCAFLNVSDEYTSFMRDLAQLDQRGVKVISFDGNAHDSGIYAQDAHLDDAGQPSFTLVTPTGKAACHMQMRGMHNVSNACAAAAVGSYCGMEAAEIAAALQAALPVAGRQQVLHTDEGIMVIDDSYNANPDSMRASLAMFSALSVTGRRFAVVGDMGELGDYSRAAHRSIGAYASTLPLYAMVCVGSLAGDIAQAAREGGMDESCIVEVDTAQDVLPVLEKWLKSGDAVLVKASHSVGLDRVVKGLVN